LTGGVSEDIPAVFAFARQISFCRSVIGWNLTHHVAEFAAHP
jgi:hypothetical protein